MYYIPFISSYSGFVFLSVWQKCFYKTFYNTTTYIWPLCLQYQYNLSYFRQEYVPLLWVTAIVFPQYLWLSVAWVFRLIVIVRWVKITEMFCVCNPITHGFNKDKSDLVNLNISYDYFQPLCQKSLLVFALTYCKLSFEVYTVARCIFIKG